MPTTFRSEVLPFDLHPKDGQVLVKVNWLSLDPAMRGWLSDKRSYLPPVQIGETMRATGLGTVVETGKGSEFSNGDIVRGVFGWTEYAIMDDKQCEKIVPLPGADTLDYLNTLGMPGMTAYFGLQDIGKLKSGETLVVSGAAGSVGSLACQLGKKAGAKVIAIAGSDEKCAWLEKELGVDKALNYKSETFYQDWKSLGYLDVYFDNVGGSILDFALTRLNKGARIVLCGAISEYNSVKPKGLQSYLSLISQRAKIEGFLVLDYKSQFPSAIKDIMPSLIDGSIKRKFHIIEGLEKAPETLPLLFSGLNTGKLVIKVAAEDGLSKL
jgi:hypothetical protein